MVRVAAIGRGMDGLIFTKLSALATMLVRQTPSMERVKLSNDLTVTTDFKVDLYVQDCPKNPQFLAFTTS